MQTSYLELRAKLRSTGDKETVFQMGQGGPVEICSWPPELSERVIKADRLHIGNCIETVVGLKPGDVLAELYSLETPDSDLKNYEPAESGGPPDSICLREVLGIDPVRGMIFYYDMFAGDVSLETLTLDPDWPLYRAELLTSATPAAELANAA